MAGSSSVHLFKMNTELTLQEATQYMLEENYTFIKNIIASVNAHIQRITQELADAPTREVHSKVMQLVDVIESYNMLLVGLGALSRNTKSFANEI